MSLKSKAKYIDFPAIALIIAIILVPAAVALVA
jgi:hypothetical protein